ncbi:MAG: RNA-binding S4 domain-containing protein [Sphingobacteriales bacterium]|jgi:ribosome-associated heat shock protein Hsp15|nr:RNA-binding S4 domain-containing protein [Sphingobacteriales bacterium]MBP9140119.1 RNA-binding S4 domain-containing protein [Chitinophagales bacterium]MDA0198233.1 RNA-binding S4 domain-containing protein [Bacteroidota bacterium]MBK6889980.1 RNA-binding S4 domain-containing protein [Sphingobacteriales bacterium]MBK7527497.1 RNA-binding S4 domain-containing protein [Sphingobacteriales bacterium]
MSIIAPSKIRIDKWLFAVRIFKTRTLAADACKSGKIKINGQPAKPAADITLNDEIFIHKGPERKLLKVAAIIENRVGAPQAVLCYIDITPPEMNPHILLKLPGAFVTTPVRQRGTGRPTKKERRDIDNFNDQTKTDLPLD